MNPKAVNYKAINPEFKKEYRKFIEDYILRLLGIVRPKIREINEQVENREGNVIRKGEFTLCFSASNQRLFEVWVDGEAGLSEDNISLASRVVQEFFNIAQYKRTGSGRRNYYPKGINSSEYMTYADQMYKKAVEKGIYHWITGDKGGGYIDEFFSILDLWSVKTYEGRRVSMGFVINPHKKSRFDDTFGNWLSFMRSDAAAVLTDCIHAVIELDTNCNFLGYLTISDGNKLEMSELSFKVPLRFTHTIQTYVTGDKVGIFLLNNGDIILAKDKEVRFVKRNQQWLNMSYEAFRNSIAQLYMREKGEKEEKENENKVDKEKAGQNGDELIKSIFASVLDVSFSHTGGIIAIAESAWMDSTLFCESGIMNPLDALNERVTNEELFERYNMELSELSLQNGKNGLYDKSMQEEDLRRRLLKRSLLQSLIGGKRFQDIDRKLRSELIALDGACILDSKGNVLSFGAIIQNNSGSSGGGRAAAAKKLSAYGMAVKISTDGYIEVYINETVKYKVG